MTDDKELLQPDANELTPEEMQKLVADNLPFILKKLEAMATNKLKECTPEEIAEAAENSKQTLLERFPSGTATKKELEDLRLEILCNVFPELADLIAAVSQEQPAENNPDQPELFPPEEIPKTDFFTPRYAEAVKILTSQLARKLPDYANSDGDGQSHGELAINEKGNPVIQFDFNSDAVAITGRAFTRFDKQVHDAVCTLWGNGITEFYTDQVYKAMNRLPGDANIDGVNLEAVENSLKAAVVRRITIDATEQFKKRFPKATIVKTAKWTDYLLPMRQIELTTKMGNVVNGWQISNPPAVFAYSDMLNQIATVPVKMLDTRRRVKNTPEVALMRDKLTERIEWMKNNSGRASKTVLYSPLFAECGIDESSLNRAQIRRKRELVKKILDGFQDNGYIKGYTEEKSGQTLTGVKINV